MMNELIIFAALQIIDNDEDQIFVTELYENYYNLMYKKAFERTNNKYETEDIVQEAFIKLIKEILLLKTFKRNTLINYIVSAVNSVFVDHMRTLQRDMKIQAENDEYDDKDMETPEKIYLDQYTADELHSAVKHLKFKYKFILECKYFQYMQDKDIAEVLGITPEDVRQSLSRARKTLQKILEMEYNVNGKK